MACQALGRCRICARKHKIAVFGGEKTQHFFIEKANLKLIILNSVCIVCIAKIEKFVDKMDLDTVFGDSVKGKTDFQQSRCIESPKPASLSCDSGGETFESTDNGIKIEEFDLEGDDNSDSTPLKIDDTRSQRDSTTSNCDNRASRNDATAETPFTHRGDSQSRGSPHPAAPQRIGLDKVARGDEPCRKRPMIRLAADAMSVIQSTASTPICVSGAKKVARFLRCDFCNKEFTHAGDMNKHRRKHTGEKPYECNQCQRKFAHASNLARHQRVHSGERPFPCTKCGRAFTRRDKLGIHIAADKCTQLHQNDSLISQAEITGS